MGDELLFEVKPSCGADPEVLAVQLESRTDALMAASLDAECDAGLFRAEDAAHRFGVVPDSLPRTIVARVVIVVVEPVVVGVLELRPEVAFLGMGIEIRHCQVVAAPVVVAVAADRVPEDPFSAVSHADLRAVVGGVNASAEHSQPVVLVPAGSEASERPLHGKRDEEFAAGGEGVLR